MPRHMSTFETIQREGLTCGWRHGEHNMQMSDTRCSPLHRQVFDSTVKGKYMRSTLQALNWIVHWGPDHAVDGDGAPLALAPHARQCLQVVRRVLRPGAVCSTSV